MMHIKLCQLFTTKLLSVKIFPLVPGEELYLFNLMLDCFLP